MEVSSLLGTKKYLLTGFVLSVSLLLGACGNEDKVQGLMDTLEDQTLKTKEFSADSTVVVKAFDTSSEKEISSLSTEKKMKVKADFAENEMFLQIQKNLNESASEIYIKDHMMYSNPYGDWTVYPMLDSEFGEALYIKDISSILKELKQVKNEIVYSKDGEYIILEVKDSDSIRFDKESLEAIYGPAQGLYKADINSYSLMMKIDAQTNFPLSIDRKVTIEFNNVAFKTDTQITYHSFEKVDVKVPEEAQKARIPE